MYTNNPIADFHRYDAEQNRRLERLPVCHNCGEPIQQNRAVHIDDWWFCDDCLKDLREDIEDDEDGWW